MERRTNSLAIGSLVISIIGLVINLLGIVPVVAILLATSALIHINDKGGEGKGIAKFAIFLGVAGLVLTVLRFALCFSFLGMV